MKRDSIEKLMTLKDKEDARKVYAMVTNIDDNIGNKCNALAQLIRFK